MIGTSNPPHYRCQPLTFAPGARSACRRLSCTGAGFEFLGLPLEFFGELHQFASRRIVPRQPLRQSQTSLGFVPEIGRVHRWNPRAQKSPRLMIRSVSGSRRVAVTGITDWTHA